MSHMHKATCSMYLHVAVCNAREHVSTSVGCMWVGGTKNSPLLLTPVPGCGNAPARRITFMPTAV